MKSPISVRAVEGDSECGHGRGRFHATVHVLRVETASLCKRRAESDAQLGNLTYHLRPRTWRPFEELDETRGMRA